MKLLFSIVLLFGLTGVAVADTVPLPRPRPADLGAAVPESGEEAAKTEDEKKPEEPPPPSACFVRLQDLAVIRQLPPINKPGGCVATDVVQLDAIILADKRQIAMEPAATMRCGMAAAITDWVREEIAPSVAAQLGAPLRAVENYDSFDCRGRNNIRGALLSEHGKANALDIRSLKLVNGTVAQPTDPNVSKDFRDALRKSACARFMTVLGPGSDGYHEDHVHVDLAERRNNYSLCQWEVRLPVYRTWPSPHIVSNGNPPAHVAGLIVPLAAGAAAPKADDKARPPLRSGYSR